MKTRILRISLFCLIITFSAGCAHSPKTFEVIQTVDNWWLSLKNENPNYYEIISISENLVIHLCGSRAKMFVEFQKSHPDKSLMNLLSSNTFMFTIHYPRLGLIYVWLVVKIRDGKVIFHKWATGHEFIRLLSLYSDNLLNADRY